MFSLLSLSISTWGLRRTGFSTTSSTRSPTPSKVSGSAPCHPTRISKTFSNFQGWSLLGLCHIYPGFWRVVTTDRQIALCQGIYTSVNTMQCDRQVFRGRTLSLPSAVFVPFWNAALEKRLGTLRGIPSKQSQNFKKNELSWFRWILF